MKKQKTYLTKNKKASLEDILSRGGDTYVSDYGNVIDFYLSGPVGDPEDYVDWFHTITNARETDVIRIHINSPGGNLFTTVQFLQVLADSKARIIMNVAGACMSAATLIFLSGDEYLVNEHSVFLFHNYSGGVIGKGGEMYHSVMHERKWTEQIMRSAYKDFLTEEEISNLIEDKDVWMDARTVINRLNLRNDKLEKAETEKAKPSQKNKKSK